MIEEREVEEANPNLYSGYDFRASPKDRLAEAVAFLKEELPEATIWVDKHEGPEYCIVVEGESDPHCLRHLWENLDRLVQGRVRHALYNNGIEMFIVP